ncbi:MAG TPA: histidine phosphatase family protein [Geminicoccaceae bacterium]|nr:histidine phosphatase family protein [Geminicoccaceae bacterium]
MARRGLGRTRLAAAVALAVLGPAAAAAAEDAAAERAWTALREGRAVAVMRHASAPGTGDPPGFRPGDCATQRNLSAAGREEARAIGRAFRAHGIAAAPVYSSRWCRCLETAELLGLGPVEPLPALDSFFRDRAREGEQTEALRAFILDPRNGGRPRVFVTHQVNVTALTGVYPRSGEVVVVEPSPDAGDLRVVGSIPPPGGT